MGRAAIKISFKDYIPKDNIFFDRFNSEGYIQKEDELNKYLEGDFSYIKDLVKARGYIADKLELDPRLSEVNRWWLEKTAPNCEIVDDIEKAKDVLNQFLGEEEITEEYRITQKELNDFMKVAEIQGIEEEIFNKLINRLPGLAKSNDETTTYT